MPNNIDLTIAPFNKLNDRQKKTLINHLDIAYFRHGDTLLYQGQPSEHLFIIIKGIAEERSSSNGEIYAHYTNDDIFDVRSQLEQPVKHTYQAIEDTLCHLLPAAIFLTLYHENTEFAAYFNSSLATRKALMTQAHQQQT